MIGWDSVYGAIRDFEPLDGVWLTHKHIETGELLGPAVPFGVPTRVVRARQTADGWQEFATTSSPGTNAAP